MAGLYKKFALASFCLCVMGVLLVKPALAADFSEGTANFTVRFSDKLFYSDANFMMPLFESQQTSAFFVNPGVGYDHRLKGGSRNTERFSIGLGQRLFLPGEQFSGHLLRKGVIIGWNGYLDTQYSMYSNFMTKGGLGGEFLSDWVDVRLNGYLSLTDEKSLGKPKNTSPYYGVAYYRDAANHTHETLRSGVDTEAGLRLPVTEHLGQMRVFGGLYYFDAKHVSSISGITTRFEWKPIPFVSLGAGWTNSNKLHGENWNLGVGFHLPLSFNALMGGGSLISTDFTPATGNIWNDRYTSPVRRNTF